MRYEALWIAARTAGCEEGTRQLCEVRPSERVPPALPVNKTHRHSNCPHEYKNKLTIRRPRTRVLDHQRRVELRRGDVDDDLRFFLGHEVADQVQPWVSRHPRDLHEPTVARHECSGLTARVVPLDEPPRVRERWKGAEIRGCAAGGGHLVAHELRHERRVRGRVWAARADGFERGAE